MRKLLPTNGTYSLRPLHWIKYLVVHHVAAEMTGDTTEKTIQTARYHINTKGWPGIGYHWFLDDNGDLALCNADEVVSAHVKGRNHESLGICLEGNLSEHPPTEAQVDKLGKWIRWYKTLYPYAQVAGHKDVALPGNATACPGSLWEQWKLGV